MEFNVGDQVVHWTFGVGKIIGVEERALADQTALFYLVQVRDLTICVPVDTRTESRLRAPKSSLDFKELFAILQGSGELLADDRFVRKSQLRKELADGKAESICLVIRDLTALARKKSLNDDDKNILRRAESLLCAEWAYSLSVPLTQAEGDLQQMLVNATV